MLTIGNVNLNDLDIEIIRTYSANRGGLLTYEPWAPDEYPDSGIECKFNDGTRYIFIKKRTGELIIADCQ